MEKISHTVFLHDTHHIATLFKAIYQFQLLIVSGHPTAQSHSKPWIFLIDKVEFLAIFVLGKIDVTNQYGNRIC
ncbi:MAG TPA: hypothetical protein VIQ97_05160 [Prevotella sp.]